MREKEQVTVEGVLTPSFLLTSSQTSQSMTVKWALEIRSCSLGAPAFIPMAACRGVDCRPAGCMLTGRCRVVFGCCSNNISCNYSPVIGVRCESREYGHYSHGHTRSLVRKTNLVDSGGSFGRITGAVVFLHDLKKTSSGVSHTESWTVDIYLQLPVCTNNWLFSVIPP